MKYSIIGTGAIGGYYGGRLAQIGCDVDFLLNSEYDYVIKNGLHIDSVNGNFIVKPISAYKETCKMPKADIIIVALKSTANYLLHNLLQPILKQNSLIILIQNGLNLEAELSKEFPHTSIAGGMAFICSSRIGQGHIKHADYGALNVGFYSHPNYELLEQVRDDFQRANVPFTITQNLNEARWRKLVWNIPYNGLTVALETSTDKIMREKTSRQLVVELMHEVINGAKACGENIELEFIDKMLSMTDNMTPYSPSMKLDYDNNRPLEIDAIYTNPIRIAKENGYYMHKTEMLEQILRFKENNYLKK